MLKTETELDVRFHECDMGAVVHHGVYTNWYEAARMDFYEALGYPFLSLEGLGLALPVVDLHLSYHAPVRFPGRVRITTSIASFAPR